jgi:hypothetical protein
MRTLEQLAEKDKPENRGLLAILEAGTDEDRSVDRLLKMHEAAQLELQDLEADFQFRLQESILQTEAKLKHRFAEQEQRLEEELRAAESHWNTERNSLGQRITTLEEEIACSKKMGQQVLEMKLGEVAREKARLEKELREAYACRNLGDPRLEKLKRSKVLPRIWEL